jgi:predicted Zn-dependent peptidase
MMESHKTVLENGLRVIIAPQKDNPAVTVAVLVEVGSKYESHDSNGISHFLEHMCFKGTESRPKAIQISTELDKLGASYNAFTSNEYTGYYAKVDKGHFEKALDVVSDIYLHQIFEAEEIEKEKGVIIEELNMYEDIPQRKVADKFTELLYGDQPAGWDVGGRKEVIRTLKRDDFVDYRKNHYVASATTVVVAGSVNEKDALEKIKKAFEGMSTGEKADKLGVKEEQDAPRLLITNKDSEQSHIALGARAYNLFDERRYAANVIANILGGGMSSRLWIRIREEMGAAYYVRCDTDELTDTGYLMVHAGIENGKLVSVIEKTLAEFKKLKEEMVSDEELQKTKDQMIGRLMLGLETSDSVAFYYGMQELLTRTLMKPDELAEKVRKVTAESVRKVANDMFRNDKLNLAVIGPVKDEAKLKSVLKID